jgi:hypothetical protein
VSLHLDLSLLTRLASLSSPGSSRHVICIEVYLHTRWKFPCSKIVSSTGDSVNCPKIPAYKLSRQIVDHTHDLAGLKMAVLHVPQSRGRLFHFGTMQL